MNTPNPKRPRHEESSSISSSVQNPNYFHPDFTISSFIALPDSPLFTSCSFDRVLDQVLSSASDDDSVQDQLIIRTRKLVSLLGESVERCYRNRSSVHNYNSWSLPQELTIKVFSMLDTKSLMQAAACCTMLNKYAMDPLCYSNIDLTMTKKRINGDVLCSMIRRSGKELRTLILRDCSYLQPFEMLRFSESLITGEYRFIRHIDVSNGYKRFSIPENLLTKLKQERSDVTIVGFS